jgi:hypothetical protein
MRLPGCVVTVLLFEEPTIPVAEAEHESSDDEKSQKARSDAHEREISVS